MSDILKSNELANLPLPDLAIIGIENPASLDYRREIAKRLAQATGCSEALLFDDVVFAVPENQRHQLHALPGYERVLLPGLLLSPGFKEGVTTLVLAPPNPVEMRVLINYKNQLELAGLKPVNYRVLYQPPSTPYFIDLISYYLQNPDEYMKLCLEYAELMDDLQSVQSIRSTAHLELARNLLLSHKPNRRVLVIPFQTTEQHYKYLGDLNVVLPDIPNLDKAFNAFLLRKYEFPYINPTTLAIISTTGEIVYDLYSYEIAKTHYDKLPVSSDENIIRFARGIVSAMDRIFQKGAFPFIKMDTKGVSGIGNITPADCPLTFDPSVDFEQRCKDLANVIKQRIKNHPLPFAALVEEKIEADMNQGVKQDYGVGGQIINGIFLPTSIFPFSTDDRGVYDRGWISANAQNIGEDPQLYRELFIAASKMTKILSMNGYSNGIFSADAFITPEKHIVFHDYNYRRGGRSTPESVIVFYPNQGFFEAQIIIHSGDGISIPKDNRQLFRLYTQTCQKLFDQGIIPFSTSFGYFGKNPHGDNFLKFKLLVPVPLLTTPRFSHLEEVCQLVKNKVKDSL